METENKYSDINPSPWKHKNTATKSVTMETNNRLSEKSITIETQNKYNNGPSPLKHRTMWQINSEKHKITFPLVEAYHLAVKMFSRRSTRDELKIPRLIHTQWGNPKSKNKCVDRCALVPDYWLRCLPLKTLESSNTAFTTVQNETNLAVSLDFSQQNLLSRPSVHCVSLRVTERYSAVLSHKIQGVLRFRSRLSWFTSLCL